MDPYEILYQDEDILAANKLAPLPVQKDKSGDPDLQGLIKKERLKPSAFLEAAHRIDRRTSGIILFAKNKSALRVLDEAFRDRTIRKTYIACLEREPIPPEGELVHLIVRDPRHNLTVARSVDAPGSLVPGESAAGKDSPGNASPRSAQIAKLGYRLILRTDRYFFVEVSPHTGRHHQIRAQFSAMGWPIKGDLKYGAKRSSPSGRIMLHGWRIEFIHPRTGESMDIKAPFPLDETLWQIFSESTEGQVVEKSEGLE
ncbi:MAG: RluA family pseudouridine synthase [Spirochaetes bacterium]|nr:RluA family pseudouridine synthase [Spirochaetota bacterium]